MLQNDFFTIRSIKKEDDSFRILLELNAANKIFEGHFPGQPVVPGACLMQMVLEVTGAVLGYQKLMLVKAGHLKFTALIDPNAQQELEMRFTYSEKQDSSIIVSGALSANNSADLPDKAKPCFKFSGLLFREESRAGLG
jgi:3-hydroxyacyl-[acyl-carrier-protein] dehydratase